MFKKEIRGLIIAFSLMSLGGLLLHIRIHPVNEEIFNWIPVVFGVLGTFVLPFLLNQKRTVTVAYLINFTAVIIGTITMAAHSIEHWELPVTLTNILLRSTVPDIIILAAKLPIAHFILRYHLPAKSSL